MRKQGIVMEEYKYEVAFSFLQDDESLALKINDLIQERLSTFLYSKKQEELAGTDGEESFNKVFGKEARVVVVLYRSNWGNTPWTRIEETAIRNRAFKEGYDFTLFIPLDKPPQTPKWLPKTQIWTNIERYGIVGAANIIETKVGQTGGTVREESLEERATRLKRQIDNEQKRISFLKSGEGVHTALKELNLMITHIDTSVKNISSQVGFDINVVHETNRGALQWIEIYDQQFCVCIEWYSPFSNTLDDSRLDIVLFRGRPKRPNRFTFHEPQKLRQFLFSFDLDQAQTYG